jgi:hypothetical protein
MDPLAPADANHLAFDLTFLKQSVPTEPVSKSRQTDSKRNQKLIMRSTPNRSYPERSWLTSVDRSPRQQPEQLYRLARCREYDRVRRAWLILNCLCRVREWVVRNRVGAQVAPI